MLAALPPLKGTEESNELASKGVHSRDFKSPVG